MIVEKANDIQVVKKAEEQNQLGSRKFGKQNTLVDSYANSKLTEIEKRINDKVSAAGNSSANTLTARIERGEIKKDVIRKATDEDSCGVQYGERLINLVADGNARTIDAMDVDKFEPAWNYNLPGAHRARLLTM